MARKPPGSGGKEIAVDFNHGFSDSWGFAWRAAGAMNIVREKQREHVGQQRNH